ncbi:MAG: transporter [Candidatus Velthaea sp.]
MRHTIVCATLVALLAAGIQRVEAQTPPPGAAATADPRVDELRRRLDALMQQNAAQQSQIDALRRELSGLQPAAPSSAAPSAAAPPPAGSSAAQPVVKQAPAASSVESVYQAQGASFIRRLTITPSIAHTYSDNRYFTLNGFLALGAVFLGNVNVTQERSDLAVAQLTGAYGITRRLQLEASLPYYFRSTTFSSVGAQNAGQLASQVNTSYSGIGDAQFGGYYQLRSENSRSPAITLNAHVSLPTGQAPYGIKLLVDKTNSSLQYPATLPTGSGVVGYEAGASFVKTTDPAIWFGGVNAYFESTRHFADLSFDSQTVTPGSVTPGNALQFSLGTAFALNEKTSLSFSFLNTLTANTRLHPDNQAAQTVVGSSTNAAALDISAAYAAKDRQTVVTDLQLGLTKDAPNFQIGVRFPRRF